VHPGSARRSASGWHNALRPKAGVTIVVLPAPARPPNCRRSCERAVYPRPGERHAGPPPLDGPFFRFASGQTDGLLALGEVRLPPLTSGPNLHVHANEDETFFVLDGVMTVQVADQLYEIAAGGLAWGARGIQDALQIVQRTRCTS
jgi:mannose-6-phosphate isomerase-like protein (cupin superfamily)